MIASPCDREEDGLLTEKDEVWEVIARWLEEIPSLRGNDVCQREMVQFLSYIRMNYRLAFFMWIVH